MPKAVKLSFIILGGLSVIMILFAGATLSQKAKLQKEKAVLESDVKGYKDREVGYIQQNKDLETKLGAIEKEKESLARQIKDLEEVKMANLRDEVNRLTKEKDKWQGRLDRLQNERDELVEKLKKKPEKEIVYVEKEKKETPPTPARPTEPQGITAPPEATEESYWAGVLREKASLQLELEKLQKEVSDANVELVEVKKQNSDLQMELGEVKNKYDNMEGEIKKGKDLAETLSLEVARTQNEKKFLNSRLTAISGENNDLREKIKQLTSTKIALEKSIVRMQDEKKTLEDKLTETENVIQNRINQIWDIKQDIESSFKPAKTNQKGEVELTPIVVSSTTRESSRYPQTPQGSKGLGYEGNVVSVNEDNNFVVVDLGKTDGVRLGDSLGVYRGAEYVAGLEVIQVRDDIAAADIKSKVTDIKVGDVVR